MYVVKKTFEVAGAHSLQLSHQSKCSNLHGHNWVITVYVAAAELNENGMVVDFTHIKQAVSNKLDHMNLNDIFDFNTTAENLAKWIADEVDKLVDANSDEGDERVCGCYKVDVQESAGNLATYVDHIWLMMSGLAGVLPV